MSADGNWKITISTPMGPQEVNAQITTSGDSFTGRTESQMGSQEITGKVAGDTLTWSAVPNATSYNIYQGLSAGGEAATPVLNLSGTSATLSGGTETVAGVATTHLSRSFFLSFAGTGRFERSIRSRFSASRKPVTRSSIVTDRFPIWTTVEGAASGPDKRRLRRS